MMVNPIQAVLFDMGGTLENIYYDEAIRQEATGALRELLKERGLDPGLNLPDLKAAVLAGMKAYQEWREKSEIELSPEQVWVEYIFPDCGLPQDRLRASAEDLTFFYETHFQMRRLRPEAPDVLESLQARGFRLAIISNIISRRVVPQSLKWYGIEHYFDPVITSSGFGWRKPNARIFVEAARLMNLPAAACAYVGDTVSRDVIGARRAGYGLAIQIKSSLTEEADSGTAAPQGQGPAVLPKDSGLPAPDAMVHDLMQVVGLVAQESTGRRTKG